MSVVAGQPQPFDWTYTRADLNAFLIRLADQPAADLPLQHDPRRTCGDDH